MKETIPFFHSFRTSGQLLSNKRILEGVNSDKSLDLPILKPKNRHYEKLNSTKKQRQMSIKNAINYIQIYIIQAL
jgi:hypothetical protein